MEAGGVSAPERSRGAPVLAVGRALKHSGGRCSEFSRGTVSQDRVQPACRGVGRKGQSSPFELRRRGCSYSTR